MDNLGLRNQLKITLTEMEDTDSVELIFDETCFNVCPAMMVRVHKPADIAFDLDTIHVIVPEGYMVFPAEALKSFRFRGPKR